MLGMFICLFTYSYLKVNIFKSVAGRNCIKLVLNDIHTDIYANEKSKSLERMT